MKSIFGASMLITVLTIAFFSCEKKPTETIVKTSSYEVIQDQIFTMSCAVSGCHSSTSDASYAQHGLVLSKNVSYENLIGKMSKNSAAATLKLQLVKPFDADNSFLMHKISCSASHHSSSANFGSLMPLGGNYLTMGQVEFVKRWINAGAKKDGETVDVSVLKDSTACQQEITPLAVPAAGTGFQLKIDLFDIPKNFEREIFIRKNSPNTQIAYVNRIEMKGRSNSHHFVVYGFRSSLLGLPTTDIMRDLRNSDGSLNVKTTTEMQNHIFLGGGTDVNTDITLPSGVALKLDPATPMDLNAHYFNRTSFTLKGENYVNFYTVPASSVQNVAQTLDLNNFDISIPAGQTKTLSKNFTFSSTTRIAMLTSHFHRLGQKFVIKIYGGARNGEIVYTNTDWEHPLVKSFSTPIVLQTGEGLTSEVTYNNITTKAVGFGLTSEDEMNIIFGYYY
jgi:hypothetical protein